MWRIFPMYLQKNYLNWNNNVKNMSGICTLSIGTCIQGIRPLHNFRELIKLKDGLTKKMH